MMNVIIVKPQNKKIAPEYRKAKENNTFIKYHRNNEVSIKMITTDWVTLILVIAAIFAIRPIVGLILDRLRDQGLMKLDDETMRRIKEKRNDT